VLFKVKYLTFTTKNYHQ